MATSVRSVDFLPEIFQTSTNKQFLSSTLDQLVQEPKLKATQGYIGRNVGVGVNPNDSYVVEPTAERANYQLEPGVVFLEKNTNNVQDVITYPGMIDSLALAGANVSRADRLFNSEYYAFDPLVDYDKFVNFGQYYWLPQGPDRVNVSATDIPLTDDFTVTRTTSGYTISGYAPTLPTITLARQGNYTFTVNQTGNPFWIQATPGTDGTLTWSSQSSREVLGVTNNGEDNGTVSFNVPRADAQNFYFTLADAGTVDLVSDVDLDEINNVRLSTFLENNENGIDGIKDLRSRTVIFTTTVDGLAGGWTLDGSTEITDDATKYAIWRINFSSDADPIMTLSVVKEVDNLSKLLVNYGTVAGGSTYYKDANGYYVRQPLLTANLDVLYYQDQNDATNFGVINLVDQPTDAYIDINDILSIDVYTSPNGVVFTNGLKVQFEGTTVPESYSGNSYYVEGVGEQITLTPVSQMITPETYTVSDSVPFDSVAFDASPFESSLNAPDTQDYMTINRASLDRNAWTRSNRWFHIDVINATATYNKTTAIIDDDYRAKRPILEFVSGLKLFGFGTQAIDAIDIIDFRETDAFSNINGTIGYVLDGYAFAQGSRVIFAADLDPAVRNKVYTVNFVQFDDSSEPVIDLQEADINSPSISANQCVLVTSGITLQGTSYYFDGSNWISAQQKTKVNQPPLFDVFDSDEYSFGDTTKYEGSSFIGSKLFSYAEGTGVEDTVLGQSLKYLSINNVGDITFANNLYTDTFVYVSGNISISSNVSEGHAKQYSSLTDYTKKIGWQTVTNEVTSKQIFNFEYASLPLVLDIEVDTIGTAVPVKVFVNGAFVLPNTYTYATNNQGVTVITFTTEPSVGALIEVQVTSNTASNVAHYSIPLNLENNSVNINTNEFTLGTIRNHYNSICQNLQSFAGKINGANNLRDLGNVVVYGENIVQHSSPLTFASTFLKDKDFSYFKAIDWASYEYEKFKNVMLDQVAKNDWSGKTNAYILDNIFTTMNSGKNEYSPFYWSDMVPCGNSYDETKYTYTTISTNVFDTLYSYDFTKANYKGLLVYLNNVILAGDGHDYTVATDGPRITINTDKVTLSVGDVITIREYPTIVGNYVPATPASMGLGPVFEPEKFLDNTYVTPTNVIRGHDGSLTVAFNDIRDDVLLEFETRIYSNIKTANRYTQPVESVDVIPGQFRTTDYTLGEVNEILSQSFLSWVGTNKIDYKDQTYDANNKFTWNYSNSLNKLDNTLLLGGWRGIYFDLYDTDSPHTRPWEMLGLEEQPDWWEEQYGPAPYTSGNLVLWQDLRDGKINDPDADPVVINKYKRPQLLEIIPTDSEGNLLAPMDVIVGEYDQNSFQKSWVFGDQGTAETAYRRSSQYRFALQKLIALTKPAQYFSLFADLDLYKESTDYDQYLYNNRYRLNPDDIVIYGNGTSKNSYINFIVDYNRIAGLDSTTELTTTLQNLDVRLVYRLAGFSDKNYLKIYSEKSSPDSQNASLLLPDESFQILLYKNVASTEVNWSSVIVQSTSSGWAVYGYSTTKPYFEIYRSIPNGNFNTVTVAGDRVRIPKDFTNTVVRVPYGYTFTSKSSVVDFLISYGKRLNDLGMQFNSQYNNAILNWPQMAEEFVYWTNQGWSDGAIINLNPSANKIELSGNRTIVDSLTAPGNSTALLDANRQPINIRSYSVERLENNFTINALDNTTFNYLNAQFVSYEHIIVFDNTSIFNDLIYSPGTGARQLRLLLDGYVSDDWNGTLDAQGFILNQDNVKEWRPNQTYTKGEIVLYKDSFWSAGSVLPPAPAFDFNNWIKSDYTKISKGLLPNAAQKADLIRTYYDTNVANLESDADQLAFGLIGFRPRQYMANLNLDDISQVNLYKQFLGTKGTTQATNVFSSANLNKEVAEYEIFENWAINRATYGANANRSYYELKLDESQLLSNPSSVSVVNTQETNTANQRILVQDIYKQSYKITDKNILPTVVYENTDTNLPSAGYVNADNVDIQVYDINDLDQIVENIDSIALGSVVWVAKTNAFDWNIYQTNVVDPNLTQVRDNLDGTCTFTFNGNHNLAAGNTIVVKYFDADINGAYEVATVPGLRTVTVELSLPGDQTTVTGTGVVFVLETVRVTQPSDVVNLTFANSLSSGSRVWVDDIGGGDWAVYEKTNPFTSNTQLLADTEIINNEYGYSIAQGLQNQGALIGAPGYNSAAGGVYAYNKSDQISFIQKQILAPQTTGVSRFGDTMDVGGDRWAIVGASQSLSARGYAFTVERDPTNGSYFIRQCLAESGTTSSSEYGRAVAISKDERWMYVSAPGDDTVYCYNAIPVQNQRLVFTGDANTRYFETSHTIIVDDDSSSGGIASQQISVTVDNFPQQANIDWYYDNGFVIFYNAPGDGAQITIQRIQSKTFRPSVSTTIFEIEDIYTAVDIYSFNVLVNSVIQRPFIDYTFNASTKTITFTSGVTGEVLVASRSHWKLIDSITFAGIDSTGIDFGYAVTSTTDGRQLSIGVPDASAGDEQDGAGQVYVYDRSVERFRVTDASDKTYTTARTPNGPVAVKLNNTFLIQDTGYNNDGQYTVASSTVTLGTEITLKIGDIIEIETNTFKLMQTVESNAVLQDARFGEAVDQCSTNCSLYIGAPNNSAVITEGGNVERWINQNRLFGSITGTNTYSILHPGDTIRINNYDVAVSTPSTWTSASTWDRGDFVTNGSSIYVALQDVPTTIALTDTEYWELSNWIEFYANDINDANLPNISASVSNGALTLRLVNVASGDQFIKLVVLPGLGGAWTALGLKPLVYAQTITAPVIQQEGHFGSSVNIDSESDNLVVGAPDMTALLPTTFDNNTTIVDGGSVEFIDPIGRSGVVFTYDYLPSTNASTTNPGKFVYGQQIFDRQLGERDQFGHAVNYVNGVLLVGSPQSDIDDSVGNLGRVAQFNNVSSKFSWNIKYQKQPIVDVSLLNSCFTYNRTTGLVTQYLDYIDPLQGKILGAARQNINYIVGLDPAQYNTGTLNNYGQYWAQNRVGEIWWDVSTCRFIDYHQDTIEYKSRRWGQLFPGSSVDVYQWIESDVPPSEYTGAGTVKSTTSYVVNSKLDLNGVIVPRYFYWVKGLVDIVSNKTLSVQAIAQYIENPRSSGIPYLAPVAQNSVALYNCNSLLSATDTILHVEFDKIKNDDNVHIEYDLIAQNDPDSFISDGTFRKLLDSFCGVDTLGNLVPDVTLSIAEQYGVNYRPRQSMFINRFDALENYLTRANRILAQFPIVEQKQFALLNSEEPEPTSASGLWDKKVATYAELTYQNLLIAQTGYRYLVSNDETNQGLWTIYTLTADKTLLLSRVQTYDTKQFWSYIDWVKPGYSLATEVVAEVETYNDVAQVTDVSEGQSVRVIANSFGKSELYQLIDGEYVRVFAENTTIAISASIWDYSIGQFGFDVEVFDIQRFDRFPSTETRQIIKSLNEELFTDDLLIYRNELLILIFEYIMTEQNAPEWLFKTSLVDVQHKIRDLVPYPVYRRDNQDFVLDYIKEVKPYHVKIKEFSLRYDGLDNYQGNLSDFDLPAYYKTLVNQFVSPQLDGPDTLSNGEPNVSQALSTDSIWTTWPYSSWYSNYKLSLASVSLNSGGSGYTVAPQVNVTGEATRLPTLRARINTQGEVIEIEVIDSGEGFTTTPVISITGGNGTGASASPVMQNQMVRSFDTTMKFDRYEYSSSVQDWEPNTDYEEGSLVRYNNKVYSVNQVADSTELDSGNSFDPDFYTEVDNSTLTGVDRIWGLYNATANQPGRDLALLLAGIDYPGVQVDAVDFNFNTGFDVGAFDVTPFDNLDFGPEGLPTYSEDLLDAIYQSSFTDTYLGTRTTDINVDGSEFIDTYSSHAPEELVPGSEFDTLDLRVITRPGADWTGDGHGFNIQAENYIATSDTLTVDWSAQMNHVVGVSVENLSTGINLNAIQNFTVNWPAKTVTVSSGISAGDDVRVRTFGVGGGNQIFRDTFPGEDVGNSLTIDVAYDEIYEFLIIVNGVQTTDFTYAAGSEDYQTVITFGTTYDSSSAVTVVAMGTQTPQHTWSTPRGEYFVYDGSTLSFPLSESLQGTNALNIVVFQDGKRLRAPECIEYTADGSSAGPYYLPTRGGTPIGLISPNDVKVYVDNEEQFLALDWTLEPPNDGSTELYVAFNTAPDVNSQILIGVTTDADYIVNGNNLNLRTSPAGDAIINAVTFNDTSEQDILTQVFLGPSSEGTTVQVPFDAVDFDSGDFDQTTGVVIESNDLPTGRTISNNSRIEVHRNGFRLAPGEGYTASTNGIVTIGGSILGPGDVVVITSFTMAVTPEEMEYRIFQDMLGNQKLLRINANNTTKLSRALGITDDTIYVDDVTKLSDTDVPENFLGVLMVNGERITYRTKDTATNTVSGLRRGVAGTAVASHAVDSEVTDAGIGEQLPSTYQKTTTEATFTGDGTTKLFETTNITVPSAVDSTELVDAVRVKVAGTSVANTEYSITGDSPVAIEFNTAPADGLEIKVSIVTANVMYAQGEEYTTRLRYGADIIQWATSFGLDKSISLALNAIAASGQNADVNLVGMATQIAVDGYAYGDLNSSGAITALDALYAAQYGAGTLPDGAIKTRIEEVFIPRLRVERRNDPVTYNQYFGTPTTIRTLVGPTASDGVALQEQTTDAARFIKGEI